MAQYTREWAAYVDWCTATNRGPLPTHPDDVLTYLSEENPTRGTAGRWVAAIRTAHRQAGFPDPCLGGVETWLRRRRASHSTHPDALVADLGPIIEALPVAGWPVGFFGRRDRLALLLHQLGSIPATALAGLSADAVEILEPGTVQVTTAERVWTVTDPGDPQVCPACSAVRWESALNRVADFDTRGLAATLTRAATTQPVMTEQISEHICHNTDLAWPIGWPLFPAINRWGHTAVPPIPAISTRAMEGLLNALTTGTPPQRATLSTPSTAPAIDDARSSALARTPDPQWHQRGIIARRQAAAYLGEVLDQWDAIDNALDDLDHRIIHALHEPESRLPEGKSL